MLFNEEEIHYDLLWDSILKSFERISLDGFNIVRIGVERGLYSFGFL